MMLLGPGLLESPDSIAGGGSFNSDGYYLYDRTYAVTAGGAGVENRLRFSDGLSGGIESPVFYTPSDGVGFPTIDSSDSPEMWHGNVATPAPDNAAIRVEYLGPDSPTPELDYPTELAWVNIGTATLRLDHPASVGTSRLFCRVELARQSDLTTILARATFELVNTRTA
jgi:hypothetical protein